MQISCFRYAYTLILSDDIVNQYQAGKLTIGILPLGYTIQSLSTWTVVAVATHRKISVQIRIIMILHKVTSIMLA